MDQRREAVEVLAERDHRPILDQAFEADRGIDRHHRARTADQRDARRRGREDHVGPAMQPGLVLALHAAVLGRMRLDDDDPVRVLLRERGRQAIEQQAEVIADQRRVLQQLRVLADLQRHEQVRRQLGRQLARQLRCAHRLQPGPGGGTQQAPQLRQRTAPAAGLDRPDRHALVGRRGRRCCRRRLIAEVPPLARHRGRRRGVVHAAGIELHGVRKVAVLGKQHR